MNAWRGWLLVPFGALVLVSAGTGPPEELRVEEVERHGEASVVLEARGKLAGTGTGPVVAQAILPPELLGEGWGLTRRARVDLKGEAVVIWEELADDRYEITLHIPGKKKVEVSVRLEAAQEPESTPVMGAVEILPRQRDVSYGPGDLLPFAWTGNADSYRVELLERDAGLLIHGQQVVEHGIQLPVALFRPGVDYLLRVAQADETLRFGPATSLGLKLLIKRTGGPVRCPECGGTGVRTMARRCPVCAGRGTVRSGIQADTVCGSCQGTGERVEKQTCMTCRGKGVVEGGATVFGLEETSVSG